ncbi:hypothetical protein B0T24DRAFT_239616 [Lasiosphaeria ovina]|uniref:Uncharacterized protein n=1 Tax=Lasiosphaeria ovina TaxID=92902 RepID=A0AAE0NCB2_9PEZI|nr:hypothetical protein B0T24DRAFT_239616 [Lasiosphaeria ovina]
MKLFSTLVNPDGITNSLSTSLAGTERGRLTRSPARSPKSLAGAEHINCMPGDWQYCCCIFRLIYDTFVGARNQPCMPCQGKDEMHGRLHPKDRIYYGKSRAVDVKCQAYDFIIGTKGGGESQGQGDGLKISGEQEEEMVNNNHGEKVYLDYK